MQFLPVQVPVQAEIRPKDASSGQGQDHLRMVLRAPLILQAEVLCPAQCVLELHRALN